MRLRKIVNLKGWHERRLQVGYGTRDKTVLKQTSRGKVYFLAKTYDKEVGELRSEVCASNIGRLFRFPVQQTWLCRIPQHKSLHLRHPVGILIQLDVRRQRDTRRGQFREDLKHAIDLISPIDKKFARAKIKEKRKFYTLQGTVDAIRTYIVTHPEASSLWDEFFELLAFDALIGGTDRHYYNWGVLEKADNGKFLRLAPAFDNGVSLLWKRQHRSQFMKDLLRRDFPKRAQAMFKKAGGGKYKLFEILPALYKLGDYESSKVVDQLLKRISTVRISRISSVIHNNVPRSALFRTTKDELETICLYVRVRRDLLVETLNQIQRT